MPIDSAGHASRPPSPLPVTGQAADAPQINTPVDDIYAILNRMHLSDGRKPFLGDQNFNGYKATGAGDATDAGDLVPLAQVQAMIAAVGGVPTGAMMYLASNVVPAGWLAMNGQSVSRTTYPGLYAFAIASGNLSSTPSAGQFGPGDGSTTFTLPNLFADGGYFIRPLASGRTLGSVQADELKSHSHTGSTASAGAHGHGYTAPAFVGAAAGQGGFTSVPQPVAAATSEAGLHSHDLNVNATGGTETRPKNIAYPVIIKT